jgi:hypothetical protein
MGSGAVMSAAIADVDRYAATVAVSPFKRWLQKLSTYILILLISIGMVLFQAWLSPAYAYGSTLVAQIDPESNFVTAAVEKVESAVVQVNVSRTLGGDVPDVLKPFLYHFTKFLIQIVSLVFQVVLLVSLVARCIRFIVKQY